MQEKNQEYILNDISDNLLIVNKATIEKLFSLQNNNIIILYLFYYKTAKWQKTNQIYATDEYTRKCLNWSNNKLVETKRKLKELKLIEIIQNKNDKGQINKWYIKINYYDDQKLSFTTNGKNQQLDYPEVEKFNYKMLINNNKMLINNNNMLNNKKINKKENIVSEDTPSLDPKFKIFWEAYPKKVDKIRAEKIFKKLKVSDELLNTMLEQIKKYKQTKSVKEGFILNPSTWLNNRRWEDEITTTEENTNEREYIRS